MYFNFLSIKISPLVDTPKDYGINPQAILFRPFIPFPFGLINPFRLLSAEQKL